MKANLSGAFDADRNDYVSFCETDHRCYENWQIACENSGLQVIQKLTIAEVLGRATAFKPGQTL